MRAKLFGSRGLCLGKSEEWGYFVPLSPPRKIPFLNSRAETSSKTGWGAASSVQIISTIQSYQTAGFQAGVKQAVSQGISGLNFLDFGLCKRQCV